MAVYLNNNKSNNYNNKMTITLDKDGENIIEVVYQTKLTTLTRMFEMWDSIISLDLSQLDTSNIKNMDNMFFKYVF